MRTTLLFLTVIPAALFLATPARAHGGTYRGPGSWTPPTLRCDCARVGCASCSARSLEALGDVTVRRALTRTLRRWGDLVEVETRVRFETNRSRGLVEGHAHVRHAPLFAAVSGAVEIGTGTLPACLKASVSARRDYLWERWRRRDPLLVLRLDAGAVKLRVFPITPAAPTFAIVRGFALSDDLGRPGVRVYRTGARYLVVVPRAVLDKDAQPDFVDPGGDRALFFLDEAQATKRFGAAARQAREVPCITALECAVRDHGKAAVTRHAALVAVPKGGGAPKNLTVGGPTVPPPPPQDVPPPAPPTQNVLPAAGAAGARP